MRFGFFYYSYIYRVIRYDRIECFFIVYYVIIEDVVCFVFWKWDDIFVVDCFFVFKVVEF